MKRKRDSTKTKDGEICKLGSEWASKRRSPSTDERGLTAMGYKFMSSRPSARKSRLAQPNYGNANFSGTRIQGGSAHMWAGDEDEDDEEGDWISDLGAKYMTRKKLHVARGPLPDCSAQFSPREHELELDNELDDAWIADFGMEWMRRRCRTRKGQYKVHDDAWLCELGFQWMTRARERERANHTWLSDLSSQYMMRRKRELDRGIAELGRTAYRSFLERGSTDGHGHESVWETRRKLQYSDPDAEAHMKRSKNGNSPGFGAAEVGPVDNNNKKHEVDAPVSGLATGVAHNNNQASEVGDAGHLPSHVEQEAKLIDDTDRSCRLLSQALDSEFGLLQGRDEVDASDEFRVWELDPLGDLEPTEYVNLDDDSISSSSRTQRL